MKCDNCVFGSISHSGRTLTCLSENCPVSVGDTGMVLLEDVSKYNLENCKSYKKEVLKFSENDSFAYDFLKPQSHNGMSSLM